MKIGRGYDYFDNSDYVNVRCIEIHKPILTKKDIIKNKNIIGLILLPIVGIFLLFVILSGLYSFFTLDFNYSLMMSIFMFTTLGFLLFYVGFLLIIKLPQQIRDSIAFSKKYNNNEFVLIKTDIIYIYEDCRCVDSDTSANSYLTCYYEIDRIKRQIKVSAYQTSAVTFEKNPNTYFLFTTNNGKLNEEPITLYYGNNYKIDNDIKVIC